jgi:uncharacterized protein with ParB-like and HNH nuclease domain
MGTLTDQINDKSKEIIAQDYNFSIGELISMYKDEDIDIHPEFQRFYRWTNAQKTKLIESLLLNIPIPPIYVSQRSDGKWDVIDGLQRLSTVLNFVGEYKDHSGKLLDALVLEGTELLPALAGKQYNGDGENAFAEEDRRYFKRAKISVVILKKESDSSTKYELFQRLNTGGTSLSSQEVRNCLMIMTDPQKFEYIQKMSELDGFKNSLRIGDNAINERYDLELVTRFVCLRREVDDELKSVDDLGVYLDKKIIDLFEDNSIDWDSEYAIFKKTFDLIYESMDDQAFCKYYKDRGKFAGKSLVSVFEIVAIGLGKNYGKIPEGFDFNQKLIDLWAKIEKEGISWTGDSASGRLPKTMKLGKDLYDGKIQE